MITKIESDQEIKNIDKMIKSYYHHKNNTLIGLEFPNDIPIKKIIQFKEYKSELSNSFLFSAILKLIKKKKQNGFYFCYVYNYQPNSLNEKQYFFIPLQEASKYLNYEVVYAPQTFLSVDGEWCIYFDTFNFGVLLMQSKDDFDFINSFGIDINNLVFNYLNEILHEYNRYPDKKYKKSYLDYMDNYGFSNLMNNIYGKEKANQILQSIGIIR